ncbi:MAG: nitronate monooxygenase [Proteobacteria bacterium]|nr:nitronate monooxygenase [Pseudomonadota bacterium]
MKIPKLRIGTITADTPIIQGGMGVRVSLSSLVSAVANQGGIGTLSSIGLGRIDVSRREFERSSREGLRAEIRKAQSMTRGHIAVNVMGVLSNADDLIETAVEEGIKMIVYGAGLPIKLPALVPDPEVNLVPIVSSARVAELILKRWDKRYQRLPDAFILEGPRAGGHLGFSQEQIDKPEEFNLEKLLFEVLESIKGFEDRYGRKIPIITAGGIYDGKDIVRMLSLGASGVQMGTRFVCCRECNVSDEFKQAYLNATAEDIAIIKSPVGMPGRAIRNRFVEEIEAMEKTRIKCPYKCLSACKIDNSKFCIAKALLNAYLGDVDHGLIFCGDNAHRIDKITTVKELFEELLEEFSQKHKAA